MNLLPEDIASTIITVGDPQRVSDVSKFFDKVFITKSNREFVVHTGTLNNQPITCLSTGMGTDNIDIVLNELDALVNIDFDTRLVKEHHTELTIVRLGTSGSINRNITVGAVLYSKIAVGLEGLFSWYKTKPKTVLEKKWTERIAEISQDIRPFVFEVDQTLESRFQPHYKPGITITAGGFYGPQNRQLRLVPCFDIISRLSGIKVDNDSPTNIEMETAGIYGLGALLGHKAISINAILANRITGEFAKDPKKIMEETIKESLSILCL